MAKTTEIIRYNLRERGRKHRGTPRKFNIPALVAEINGPAVQERVKHRDMLGYYGHWPRQVFGINPKEGGIVDGKVVHIEPAFVTTYLKAFDDGTVEHRTEFYDNAPGRAAEALYDNKAGGWSSAIIESSNSFFGFDYVLEPNFTANRGYAVAMDGVGADAALTLDDVQAYYDSTLEIVAMLDGVAANNERLRGEIDRAHRVIRVMQAENMDLEVALDSAIKKGAKTLDSAKAPVAVRIARGKTAAIFDSASAFLAKIGGAPERHAEQPALDSAAQARVERSRGIWNR